MRVSPFVCLCFLPGVFLSSRVTGACPVTTDLIMRVNVRTTTTTWISFLRHSHRHFPEGNLVCTCVCCLSAVYRYGSCFGFGSLIARAVRGQFQQTRRLYVRVRACANSWNLFRRTTPRVAMPSCFRWPGAVRFECGILFIFFFSSIARGLLHVRGSLVSF